MNCIVCELYLNKSDPKNALGDKRILYFTFERPIWYTVAHKFIILINLNSKHIQAGIEESNAEDSSSNSEKRYISLF